MWISADDGRENLLMAVTVVKVKVTSLLVHNMKAYRRSRITAPLILQPHH